MQTSIMPTRNDLRVLDPNLRTSFFIFQTSGQKLGLKLTSETYLDDGVTYPKSSGPRWLPAVTRASSDEGFWVGDSNGHLTLVNYTGPDYSQKVSLHGFLSYHLLINMLTYQIK